MNQALKEKVLTMLGEQRGKDKIERVQLKALRRVVESEFSEDSICADVKEEGSTFGYVFAKRAYLPEFGCGLFSGVFVTRLSGNDSVFRAYLSHCAKQIAVLDEDEKELCLQNIEAALILRENKSVG